METNSLNIAYKKNDFIFLCDGNMEFNVLPKAKLLSPHARNKAHQTNNQNVNIILPNPQPREVEVSERSEKAEHEVEINPYQNLDPEDVKYGDVKSRDVNLDEPAEKLSKEDSISTINFLKLVLQSYMDNPIKYNGYVICTVPLLEQLIEVLTGCDDCEVEFADVENGCCGATVNHIIPITKIWVQTNGSRDIFKYKYSQYLQVFDEYHISLKFVYIE